MTNDGEMAKIKDNVEYVKMAVMTNIWEMAEMIDDE